MRPSGKETRKVLKADSGDSSDCSGVRGGGRNCGQKEKGRIGGSWRSRLVCFRADAEHECELLRENQ